jgi:hypothetical protein
MYSINQPNNEKWFEQCPGISYLPMSALSSDYSQPDHNSRWNECDENMNDYLHGRTQIKQYLCGLSVDVHTAQQLWDFIKFAIVNNDHGMIVHSAHLMCQFYESVHSTDLSAIINCAQFLFQMEYHNKSIELFLSLVRQVGFDHRINVELQPDVFELFEPSSSIIPPRYEHPQIEFEKKLKAFRHHPTHDVIVHTGNKTVFAHSWVLKVHSFFFEAYNSYSSNQNIDVSGVIEEKELEPLIDLMYDQSICSSWNQNKIVVMLHMCDVMGCEVLSKHLMRSLLNNTEKASEELIVSLPKSISNSWIDALKTLLG